MRKGWLIVTLVVLVLAVLVYAWIDGGKRPLRPIAEPVPVPEARG